MAGRIRSAFSHSNSEDWSLVARLLCERAIARVAPSGMVCSILRSLLENLARCEHEGYPSGLADPEVFLRLYALNDRKIAEQKKILHAALLLVHCRLADPEDVSDTGLRFLRLVHSHGQILCLSRGGWSECQSLIATTSGLVPLQVLLPANGLFDDFLPASLYRPSKQRGSVELDRVATIEMAMETLKAYSSELYKNFRLRIRTIALTPPIRDEARRSFSCRLGYYGGIFIDVIPGDVIDAVVNLLHEYCHQQLWSFWFLRPESAIGEEGVSVRSPFTGRALPAPVMAQAYLIYSATLDFLRWAALSSNQRPALDRIANDIQKIERGLPELKASLSKSLRNSSSLTDLFAFCEQARP